VNLVKSLYIILTKIHFTTLTKLQYHHLSLFKQKSTSSKNVFISTGNWRRTSFMKLHFVYTHTYKLTKTIQTYTQLLAHEFEIE